MRALRLVHVLTSHSLLLGLLWVGLLTLSVTLLVMLRTRWGQSRTLRKCVVLSLLAHVLLAGYATTVEIVGSAADVPPEPAIEIGKVEIASPEEQAAETPGGKPEPWDDFVRKPLALPDAGQPERLPAEPIPTIERRPIQTRPFPSKMPLNDVAVTEPPQEDPRVNTARLERPLAEIARRPAEALTPPEPARRHAPDVLAPPATTPAPRRPSEDAPATDNWRPSLQMPSELVQAPDVVPPREDDAYLPPMPRPRPRRQANENQPRNELPPVDLTPPGTAQRTPTLAWEPQRLRQPADHPALRSPFAPGQGVPRVALTTVPSLGMPEPAPAGPREPELNVPELLKLRVAPDRTQLATMHGATPESEEAVQAALRWLAANQNSDGRWDADVHGAGRENLVAGRNRYGAGAHADTGLTGLALLAFLGAGHTHQKGMYQRTVGRGLEFLLRQQTRDGSLGGDAQVFAHMYCHAMATFALGEAYALTRDPRLRGPLEAAVRFTLRRQNPTTGGWRYRPEDDGDTSMLGWQLMALKSAELGGIDIPPATRNGMIRFLRSVCSGRSWGLAAYRPSEAPSRPMSAEALVCWQFLGMDRDHPASEEAANYLLGELPGSGKTNLYYWYYATLGMYQLQGSHWERWNEALQGTLLTSQRKTGPLAGSWDPNTVWGSYGGRVYSTALATLCLEVYYRYLPLYEAASGKAQVQR